MPTVKVASPAIACVAPFIIFTFRETIKRIREV
jgi:hypothetical protein